MLSRLESVQSFWIKNANFEIRRVRLTIKETLFIATRNILKRNVRVGGKFFWKKMFLYTWFHGFAALNSHSNTVISKKKERNYRNSPFRSRLMKQNFSVSIQFYRKEMLFQWSHLYLHILRLFCNYEEGKEKVLHALCTLWHMTRSPSDEGLLWVFCVTLHLTKVTWQLSAKNKRDKQVSQIPTKVDKKDSRWVEIYFTCSLERF